MKFYQSERVTLYHGDCIEVMKNLPENSVDSIVTDPPYELGFMGKSWDSSGVAFSVDVWKEALRVLKPGGHLIAFSGSRTYHRMAVAIEDAGFEIRDQIMWIYGSGFPKSLDVAKAIDKSTGENRQRQLKFVTWMRSTGLTASRANQVLRESGLITESGTIAGHYFEFTQPAIATANLFDALRPLLPEVPEEIERLVAERTGIEWTAYKNRPVLGKGASTLINATGTYAITNGEAGEEWKPKDYNITAPATAEAKQWQGWGTALKPAHEPMVLARKPLIGTVAANVLTYGTGGLNIDVSRVGSEDTRSPASKTALGMMNDDAWQAQVVMAGSANGRWPANVIHDGSDEVVELFPTVKGATSRTATKPSNATSYVLGGDANTPIYDDNGNTSAARFFYCAKASKRDRNEGLDDQPDRVLAMSNQAKAELKRGNLHKGDSGVNTASVRKNHHPTVKPTDLMRYLCRLVTPPNGTVLDPFMGSGSTGKAAMYEDFEFIGIEMTEEYLPIAKARIEFAINEEEGKL
jgi:DNA modification methylase